MKKQKRVIQEGILYDSSSFGNTHQSKCFEFTLVHKFQKDFRDRSNSRAMHIEKWLYRREEP